MAKFHLGSYFSTFFLVASIFSSDILTASSAPKSLDLAFCTQPSVDEVAVNGRLHEYLVEMNCRIPGKRNIFANNAQHFLNDLEARSFRTVFDVNELETDSDLEHIEFKVREDRALSSGRLVLDFKADLKGKQGSLIYKANSYRVKGTSLSKNTISEKLSVRFDQLTSYSIEYRISKTVEISKPKYTPVKVFSLAIQKGLLSDIKEVASEMFENFN